MRVNFIIVAFDSSTEKFVVSLVCQKFKKKIFSNFSLREMILV